MQLDTFMPLLHLLIKILSVSCLCECGLLHLRTNIAAVNLDHQQRSITTETPDLHQLQCDLEVIDKALMATSGTPASTYSTRGTDTTTVDNTV